MAKSDEKNELWQPLLQHIDQLWRKKKKNDYPYPFLGRDFKDIRQFSRLYSECGMMALWELYCETADEWTMDNGLTVYNFTRQLPRLLDHSAYKAKKYAYEEKFLPKIPSEIADAIRIVLPDKKKEPEKPVQIPPFLKTLNSKIG